MENIKVDNISKGILKRIKTERSIMDEQVYALWDGIVEMLERGDDHCNFSESAQLLERMDDIWMYQKFQSSSDSENFLYGSIWGSMNIMSRFLKKKKEQYEHQALIQKYKDDTYSLFLNAILKKPGIKNSALAKICCVTPARISQITQAAMADGLITSQKIGREKYFYLKSKGRDVCKAIQAGEKSACRSNINYSLIMFNNQMEDDGHKLRMLLDMFSAKSGEYVVEVAVAFQKKEKRVSIGQERSEFICRNEMKRLTNNCINSWELRKEINSTKQPLYMK